MWSRAGPLSLRIGRKLAACASFHTCGGQHAKVTSVCVSNITWAGNRAFEQTYEVAAELNGVV